MKIEVNDWKEFRIGDFFEVEYGSFIAQKDSINESDGFPHVTTSGINNGISYYVENSMFGGNCITVASDGAMGASFYQANPYSASNIVSNLVPKDNTPLNEYNAQFICSLLRKESEKYSWGGFKFSVGRVRETSLFLPSTPSGDPDWDYMEAYMKKMEEKAKERMDRLEEMRKQEKKKIDVSGWGEFKVGELFGIVKMRDKLTNKDIYIDGKTPVYSSTTDNNGIVGYTDLDADYIVNEKVERLVLFGDHTKSFFIAEESFCTMDNVKVLIPKNFNKYCIRYILTVWKAMIPDLGYSRHWNIAKNIKILLPVTSAGTPDWDYMERYMSKMEEKAKKRLGRLSK